MSLRIKLLQFIQRNPRPVSGGEIEDYTRTLGYTASNGLRRCRELENGGLIYATYPKGHVHYQTTATQDRPEREVVADNQESLLELPYSRPIKMPPVWESLRSKYRPRLIQSEKTGPSERPDESTALVRSLSSRQDLRSEQYLGEIK